MVCGYKTTSDGGWMDGFATFKDAPQRINNKKGWGFQPAEVNISPKNFISAQPLKMALHRNPAMHGSRMVIFLHDSKKALF